MQSELYFLYLLKEMGQSKSPLRKKFKWTQVTVLMSFLLFLVNAQDCEFGDDPSQVDKSEEIWVITGNAISEKLEPDTIIWDVGTKNVKGSIASSYPHVRYLSGLRYSNRYVYKTTENYPEFIEEEGVKTLQRNVTFDCSSEEVRVHFRFPLIDVNDPPKILIPKDELNVDLDNVEEDETINPEFPIFVEEKLDFEDENMQITVTSDRSDLLIIPDPIVIEEEENEEVGKRFKVELKLNLTEGKDKITPGRYSLNLFCTDGQYTDSGKIVINISKQTSN